MLLHIKKNEIMQKLTYEMQYLKNKQVHNEIKTNKINCKAILQKSENKNNTPAIQIFESLINHNIVKCYCIEKI